MDDTGPATETEEADEELEMDFSELTDHARELVGRAHDWVVGNPLAACGMAIVSGFLAGRTMRAWVLRP